MGSLTHVPCSTRRTVANNLSPILIFIIVVYLQDGAPKIAKLPYKWLKMVDITIVTGSYFMVYKPTNISGGPHPVASQKKVDE